MFANPRYALEENLQKRIRAKSSEYCKREQSAP